MIKPILHLALMLPRIDQRDYFLYLFGMRYIVIIDNLTPSIVVYDYFYELLPKYKSSPIYIAFTGESRDINFKCHFALSFEEHHSRNIYLPLWILFIDWFDTKDHDLCKLTDIMLRQQIKKINKTLFCGFVAKNSVPVRNNFVLALSKYKTVTCPGIILHNYPHIGGRMGYAKEQFLRCCKFTVAFENCSKSGYITEKLLHAFQSRTIPIYWGSASVNKYFNHNAFINCHDYENWDDVLAEIIRLDNDDTAYLEKLNQPVFKNDIVPAQFWPSTVLTSIENLF
ncbi:hypothetical protein LCGC14_1624460 [marine sediment metagenome]|uniref:Fucosyltransferase C-terminal domain-containing protein n=1 Tax=marine sediment metagenome TaxID=412755 RepID=A0A0F9I4S2_9ZZZZ